MRFLDEHGRLHAKLPPKEKKAKTGKLWLLGLEWQSVNKGSWAAAAREASSYKTVGGAVAIKGPKRVSENGKIAPSSTHVGLWALTFVEEEELRLTLPSRCYSLAAVFALAAQSQNQESAALYLDLGTAAGASQAYFCRLHNGVPVTDAVFTREKATELAQQAQAEGDSVYSNDQDLLTESNAIDFAWFSTATDKRALLGKVPFNWLMALIVVTVLVSLAVGVMGYRQHQEKLRLAELARLDAENDPVPKYQAALAAQRAKIGMDRAAVGRLYADLMKQTPRAISGWRLTLIECSLEGCTATWKRTQGTFADAKRERQNDKLLVPSVDGQGRIGTTPLSVIKTTLAIKPPLADLPPLLPKYEDYVLSAGVIFQKWANAGIPIQSIGIANTWPEVQGARDLKIPGMLGRGDFSVKGMNGVFGAEVIQQLPASIFIRELVIRPSTDSLTLDLTGSFYVAK